MIPRGLCQCGCGARTNISPENVRKYGYVRGEPRRFIRGHFHPDNREKRKLSDHPNWKGGRTIHRSGYVMLYCPGHPRGSRTGYVMEHVLIVERAMQKHLRISAHIHHVNEIKGDNRNSNLVACEDWAYHKLIHQRTRALRACGDASARPCEQCGSYENQNQMQFKNGRHYHVPRSSCQPKGTL